MSPQARCAALAAAASAALAFALSAQLVEPASKQAPLRAAFPSLHAPDVAAAPLRMQEDCAPPGCAQMSLTPKAEAAAARRAQPARAAFAASGACGVEVCDGIDNDCDGEVDESGAANCTPFYEDQDGDHFGAPVAVGCYCEARVGMASNDYDCDDTRASAHPGASEVCDGEIDNDCDGIADLCGAFSRQTLQTGDLGVVAFMDHPKGMMDADGEWFEIENRTDRAIELMGLEFRDDGFDHFQIDRSLVIQPKGHLVLARNGDAATNGGVPVDYVYPDFILSNFGDVIEIMNHGEMLERMSYGPRGG